MLSRTPFRRGLVSPSSRMRNREAREHARPRRVANGYSSSEPVFQRAGRFARAKAATGCCRNWLTESRFLDSPRASPPRCPSESCRSRASLCTWPAAPYPCSAGRSSSSRSISASSSATASIYDARNVAPSPRPPCSFDGPRGASRPASATDGSVGIAGSGSPLPRPPMHRVLRGSRLRAAAPGAPTVVRQEGEMRWV